MKPSRLLFAEMNRTELKTIAPETLVVMPIGATEQHGPHLPTGTDYFTVEHLCLEAAHVASEEIPLIVTPALPFGSSDHHLPFGGTLSFSTETYYRVLHDLVLSLARDGFRRIFLVNGHGGNHELAQLAARDVALLHPVSVAAGSYWVIAWDALIAANANRGCRLPGHAGIFETSMMMALRPGLVPADRPHRDQFTESDPRNFHAPYRHEQHGSWQEIDGYTDSPDLATAERGLRDSAVITKALAEAFVEFYRATSDRE
jgi:creatinine amidohydrolase